MSSINDYLAGIGVKFGQAALMVGGLFTSLILPSMLGGGKSYNKKGAGGIISFNTDVIRMLGLGMMLAGGGWYALDQSKLLGAKATFAHPGGFYDPVIPSGYANPRNNFSDVKPRNRLDLQTNYILSDKNSSFDNYVNDIVLNESKKAGINLLDKNNYPVRIEPYLLPALNPTTITTPIRDFNTVKMIA